MLFGNNFQLTYDGKRKDIYIYLTLMFILLLGRLILNGKLYYYLI